MNHDSRENKRLASLISWSQCPVTCGVFVRCHLSYPELLPRIPSPLLFWAGSNQKENMYRVKSRHLYTLKSAVDTGHHGCWHRPLLIQQHPDPQLVQLPPDCLSSGEGYQLLLRSPASWKLEVVRDKHQPGFLLGSSTSLLSPPSHSALTADLQPDSLR